MPTGYDKNADICVSGAIISALVIAMSDQYDEKMQEIS